MRAIDEQKHVDLAQSESDVSNCLNVTLLTCQSICRSILIREIRREFSFTRKLILLI